jgi:hypothetical protein
MFLFNDEVAPRLNKEELISRKFFYAGSSARYMFDMTIEEVIRCHDSALDTLDDINALLSHQMQISSKYSQGMIYAFVEVNQRNLSPGSIEPLFELRFLRSIQSGSVKYKVRGHDKVHKWKKAPIHNYDPHSPDVTLFKKKAKFWLKPISWQQVGWLNTKTKKTKYSTLISFLSK